MIFMIKRMIHQEDITLIECICTQPGNTNIQKAMTNRPKGVNLEYYNYYRAINTPLMAMDE